MEVLSKLPFDLQEHILVNVMKRYKLRDGKYVRQIDKTKYTFLDYITRRYTNRDLYTYLHNTFNNNENIEIFHFKFYIKNLHDSPIRKESHIDDDNIFVSIR